MRAPKTPVATGTPVRKSSTEALDEGFDPVERLMFRTAWKVREMIDRGEVDPHVGLSRVAWPPEALEHVASAETREASQAGEVTRTGDEPS